MTDAAAPLPIQLICTDFDGTLFAEREEPPVPLDLQRMIGDLQRLGARWVINTGRDLAGLLGAMAGLRLTIKPDYLVVAERDIYLHKNTFYLGLEDWNRTCAEAHAKLFARVRRDLPRLLTEFAELCPAAAYEDPLSPFTLVARDARDLGRMRAHLENYCRSVPGLAVLDSHVGLRFSHERYNKGTALAEVGRRLGITRDFTFVAGDHANDLPMMSRHLARWLVAPANAIDPVKEAVRVQDGYVSHQPCGCGVARGLEFFLGGGAAGLASAPVGELAI